jgi:hypothetical protein
LESADLDLLKLNITQMVVLHKLPAAVENGMRYPTIANCCR